jgi:hypothetical protein
MYALRKYVWATGDEVFLRNFGAEILVSVAGPRVLLGRKGGSSVLTVSPGPVQRGRE